MTKSRALGALAALLVTLPVSLLVSLAGPAAADITWSVVPANAGGPDGRSVIDLELAGGQQVTEHVAVTNRSTRPVDFAIDANDGYLTAKGYFDMRPSDAVPADGGAWLEIPERVTVAAGATSVVPVKVTIPQNATPGDHPAGVTASLETVSGQVRVQNRVGVRLNIRVTGDYVAKVAVSDVRAEYVQSWNPFASGSVEVTYTVANAGNVRLVTDNRVLTATLAGQSDWSDPSAARARELMPGGSRTFTARVTGAWPLGPIGTTVTAIPSPAGGPLPGVAAEQVAVQATVWALPWPQLALLVLLALAYPAVRLIAAWRRKRIQKLIRLHSRETPQEA
ncbi:DUF916 domain-containing protein [Nonomuraea sp. FMUSA5-5]|uniref:DUF916 domain-containing protein n=1 Tax=Nonomuraea composti TaxID=2720023 RepID=A0ABX1B7K1_9ACTN|nr:DUF916 domain-containing protein [Nonomuraea sp. FMUSA5-5]NJP92397.1 DUF916 domain-containing protein [Nonomuraea sp. FMUSA5-5]